MADPFGVLMIRISNLKVSVAEKHNINGVMDLFPIQRTVLADGLGLLGFQGMVPRRNGATKYLFLGKILRLWIHFLSIVLSLRWEYRAWRWARLGIPGWLDLLCSPKTVLGGKRSVLMNRSADAQSWRL